MTLVLVQGEVLDPRSGPSSPLQGMGRACALARPLPAREVFSQEGGYPTAPLPWTLLLQARNRPSCGFFLLFNQKEASRTVFNQKEASRAVFNQKEASHQFSTLFNW